MPPAWVIQLIIAIIVFVISMLLQPKPEEPENAVANLKSFTYPTVDGGRPIPEVFGTVPLEGNVIWQGPIGVVPIEQSYQKPAGWFNTVEEQYTVGFSWFAAFALALCSRVDAVTAFRINKTPTWTGTIDTSGSVKNMDVGTKSDTTPSEYSISQLFFYLGDQTAANAYMQTKTGDDIAYKDVCYIVFFHANHNNPYWAQAGIEGAFVGDNVKTVPNYSVVVRKTNLISTLLGYDFTPYNTINTHDANPASILLYILYNLIQIDITLFDIESFYDSAVTLYNESLGISFVMQDQKEVDKWVDEIIKTIDGVLYLSPLTSKFTLKLIRDDYDPDTLPIITDNNARISVERKGWEDCASEVVIVYTDRDNNYNRASVFSINPAVRTILSYRKNEEYNFMGISNITTAQAVLKRMIKKRSYPFIGVKCVVSRNDFPSIIPGDVFKLNSDILGISNLIFRVINVSSYKSFEQTIELDGMEDIFSIASMTTTSIENAQSIHYDWTIGTIDQARLIDSPAELSGLSSVIPLFTQPTGFVLAVRAYLDDIIKVKLFKPQTFGYGTLSSNYNWSDYSQGANEIDDDSGGFTVTPVSNFSEIADTRQEFQQLIHIAFVGNSTVGYEIMAIQNLTDLGGGSYQVENIMRGLFNTEVQSHTTGKEFWICYFPLQNHGTINVGDSLDLDIDLEPYNHKNVGTKKNVLHTYGFTRETPYPPFNLEAERVINDITLTWYPAKRNAGAIYKDPDGIVAGVQEVEYEGEWHVSWDSFVTYEVATTPTFARTDPVARTYQIKSYLNGLYSDSKSIFI